MTEIYTSTTHAILIELKYREKCGLKKPKCLIVSKQFFDKLFEELLPFVSFQLDQKFENPIDGFRQYMGMNLIVVDTIYGGDFNFAFGD